MKTKNLFTAMLLISAISIVSCQKDNPEDVRFKTEISGVVQKGPFNAGTSVVAFELNKSMVQTGLSFSTQITANNGSFEIKNIDLSSTLVELKADGYYFNEVSWRNLIISAHPFCFGRPEQPKPGECKYPVAPRKTTCGVPDVERVNLCGSKKHRTAGYS
jgi:hypothetical protein